MRTDKEHCDNDDQRHRKMRETIMRNHTPDVRMLCAHGCVCCTRAVGRNCAKILYTKCRAVEIKKPMAEKIPYDSCNVPVGHFSCSCATGCGVLCRGGETLATCAGIHQRGVCLAHRGRTTGTFPVVWPESCGCTTHGVDRGIVRSHVVPCSAAQRFVTFAACALFLCLLVFGASTTL